MDTDKLYFDNQTFIETVMTANDKKYVFQENTTLTQSKGVTSIDTCKVGTVSNAPSGKAIQNDAVFKKAFLVLSIKGEERINRIPFYKLDPTQNNGRTFSFTKPVIIDFQKSFIELPDTVSNVVNEVMLLNFYYLKD